MGGRYAGDDVEGDTGRNKGRYFLIEAPKHQRVASLETHDPASRGGERHHQIVDVALLARATVTLLANVDALRTRWRERKHLRRHELVVEDDICLLQRAQRLERQQLRVTRTGTDEADATGLLAAGVTDVAAGYCALVPSKARPACVTRYSAAATMCGRVETLSGWKVRACWRPLSRHNDFALSRRRRARALRFDNVADFCAA